MATDEIQRRLSEPFHPDELEWRPGATNRDKTTALALAYVTARAVMDRLDDVCGIDGWYDSYCAGPAGGVICKLSLRIGVSPDGWITKEDAAENTDIESVKGGVSDALKRAAVKFGIGRYLYGLPSSWVPCELRGQTVVLSQFPKLPEWALPESMRGISPPESEPRQQQRPPSEPNLPSTPSVSAAEISTLLAGIGITDPAMKMDNISWAIAAPVSMLTTQAKVAHAVGLWAISEGITEDVALRLVERIQGR